MKVELKRLTENELELMMNWRMREDITQVMFQDVPLTLEGQKKWFNKLKEDQTQIRWVIFADDKPIGSMYLTDIDCTNKRCEVGWFVADKETRSFKLAIALQQNMYNYIFDTMKLNRVIGHVLDNNVGVYKLNVLCGFESEGILKQHVLKNGVFHDVYAIGLTADIWAEKQKKYKIDHITIE